MNKQIEELMEIKLLLSPRNGIVLNPQKFRYEFYFCGILMGWIDEYLTLIMQGDYYDWPAHMWDRIFPKWDGEFGLDWPLIHIAEALKEDNNVGNFKD